MNAGGGDCGCLMYTCGCGIENIEFHFLLKSLNLIVFHAMWVNNYLTVQVPKTMKKSVDQQTTSLI
ncbi:hypothetical protein [Paenibacillus phytorum]|uniref:hypothetical protein n=1 Tax=Paenibacillus phytorum TaxID=2654977 RepID=UPI00149143C6|nr:hypothetical protein [Paenibacillus phytorum]